MRFFHRASQVLFIFIGVLTSGCYSSVRYDACWFDCNQALHEDWLEGKLMAINQNIYNPPYWLNYLSSIKSPGTKLSNGNIEVESGAYPNSICRRFYEYNPKSGLIVGFRFEEKNRYDCRIRP